MADTSLVRKGLRAGRAATLSASYASYPHKHLRGVGQAVIGELYEQALAAAAGLLVTQSWADAGRWFALLARPLINASLRGSRAAAPGTGGLAPC
jgi:hypothetical protein